MEERVERVEGGVEVERDGGKWEEGGDEMGGKGKTGGRVEVERDGGKWEEGGDEMGGKGKTGGRVEMKMRGVNDGGT